MATDFQKTYSAKVALTSSMSLSQSQSRLFGDVPTRSGSSLQKNNSVSFMASGSRALSGKEFRTEVEEEAALDPPMPQMPRQVGRLRRTDPKDGVMAMAEQQAVAGPLAWVDSDGFQGISALVIFGNAILIGLETDIKDEKAFFWSEQALLIFFVFELTVRLCRHGCMFFKHEDDFVWNFLDFGIVASGVSDQWIMPLVEWIKAEEGGGNKHAGTVFTLMRMLRLLRIVRLFRLVKIVRPLYQLAQGVLEALQGMFWVLIFMIMTLYAFAILCTRFIGHGVALPKDAADEEALKPIREMFKTVPDSMFALFGTMTSWSLLNFVPLLNVFPFLRPLFVLFYIYSAWALLAVMTGVVSENLIAIREQMVKEDELKEQKRKQNITNTLFALFAKADCDGSGSVSRNEFNAMLRDPSLMKILIKNSNLRVQDLHDLFDWLDHDGGGTITIDEFMVGFKWVNDPLSAKSIVKLQERLISDMLFLKHDTLDLIDQGSQEVMELITHPIRKVHAIADQMDTLDDLCTKLKTGLREDRANVPTNAEMSTTELNIHSKLDRAFDYINRMHKAVK